MEEVLCVWREVEAAHAEQVACASKRGRWRGREEEVER